MVQYLRWDFQGKPPMLHSITKSDSSWSRSHLEASSYWMGFVQSKWELSISQALFVSMDFTFHFGPLWQPVRLHHSRSTNCCLAHVTNLLASNFVTSYLTRYFLSVGITQIWVHRVRRGILSFLSTPWQQLICARVKLFTRPFPNSAPYTEEAMMSNSLSISLEVIRLCHSHVIVFSWSEQMCECVWGLSRLIWTPLKLVPTGMNIWTHSEKFVPTVDQPHQGKSVHVNSLPRTLVVSTVAYLETEWLVFISMRSVSLKQSSQK